MPLTDIKNRLLKEHSKKNARQIARLVLRQKKAFPALAEIFFGNNVLLVQRSAWPVGLVGEQRPEWFLSYLPSIIHRLQNPLHPAASRHLYRILQYMDIPETYAGEVFSLSLGETGNPKTPVAIRVFAMTTAANIAAKYPELQTELKFIIRENLPQASPGFKARAKKLLKPLETT